MQITLTSNNDLQAQAVLRQMVLTSVDSVHSKRSYGKAVDDLFDFAAGRPLTRMLIADWKSSMAGLSPSTVNVRLSAVRKLVTEAQRSGIIDLQDATILNDIPNMKQRGNRMGNWLTKQQAQALLQVPRRSTLKGKRNYAILALLIGCALRRHELSSLDVATIQMREDRWVLADLIGKGGRVRTIAVPLWVKQACDEWIVAADIKDGRLLRSMNKGGIINRASLGDNAILIIVAAAAKAIGIENFGAHDLRRTCAKLCRKAGGDIEQIKFMLGHSSISTTERYLGTEQELAVAVNDNLFN